jgi:outer membrane protein
MTRILAIGIDVLTVVTAHSAWAQDAPAVPMSLNEAIDRAVAASHRIAESIARQEGAQAAIRTRETSDAPTFGVSGGYTRTNHVDVFGVPQPGGVFRVIYPDIPDNYFSRASFQWPIYNGGRTDALVRAAEAEARASAQDVEVTRADLRLEVARTYWALVTATATVSVVQEAVARADAHLADVRSRFDNGLLPPNDVSAAEAQRSREEIQLIEARNVRSSALEDLRRLVGVAGDVVPTEPLSAAPVPPPQTTPGAPAPAAGVQASGITFLPPVERAEQRALTERIAASEERVEALAAGLRPTVSLLANGDYANPNARIFPREGLWQTSWEVGVAVNWTLWDGGRVAAESAEAQAATRALHARYAETTSLIATDVRQRQLDLASARAALRAADAAVASATETRRVLGERFDVGVATSTEVLEAQLALLQAELDRTRTLASIRLAEARLERALGRH